MKNLGKNFLAILAILLAVSLFFQFLPGSTTPSPQEAPITQIARDINESKISKITVSGDKLEAEYKDGSKVQAMKETNASLSETLANLGAEQEKIREVQISNVQEKNVWGWLGPVLTIVLPLMIFIFFFWSIFKQTKAGAMQALDFTRAKARLFGANGLHKQKITFADVAGLQEAKDELREIVEFLKNPEKFLQMGAKIPKGVLLMGPPGTGKTLLARAVASEAGVPFYSISGSEFIELFVGVGSSRVRDLFSTAKKAGKSIIFIDELDAIGRIRGTGIGGGHDEREQTLNQILVEMDGFEKETTVIVIAATNRPDVLDPALLRPGRFDRRVVLDLPDVGDREEILKIHSKDKPLDQDIYLREVAERTPGFSGADLANLVNEAAILAARRNKSQIAQTELLESIEKVLLGPERKSKVLSKKEKEIAAFHEAGHAVVSSLSDNAEPVRKISIISRGRAAGYTLKSPLEEKSMKTKSEFKSELAVLLGGYTAEKITFGDITTGASNDLERASALARRLVKQYGMSSLGPVSFGEKEELVFLGKEISEQRNYSEEVAAQIDKEVAELIKNAQIEAEKILSKNKKILEKIAKTLIEKETIEKEEYEELIFGKKKESKAKSPAKTKIRIIPDRHLA